MGYKHCLHAFVAATLLVVALPSVAHAQEKPDPDKPAITDPCTGASTYTNWVRCEVRKAVVATKGIADNGNGVANQKEAPSIDQTSTSLVDTSSASDFASLALNLTGLKTDDQDQEDDGSVDSGSVTASLYSLAAAIRGVALTDPPFYERHTNLRRVALTIGTEKSAADKHFTDKPATQFGFKLLLINRRDIYSAAAKVHFEAMDIAVGDYVAVEQAITGQLHCIIFRSVHPTASTSIPVFECTKDTLAFAAFLKTEPFNETNWPKHQAALEKDGNAVKAIQNLITPLASARGAAAEKVAAAVERIRRGRQLAVAYFTKQREDQGTDDHRAELIFDCGLSTRLNWTANASFDFSDRKASEDSKSGRVATEFQAKLGGESTRIWTARPVLLSGSGEASKDPNAEWLYRAQLKLVVPVTTGVEIPIAYTYANRDTDQVTSGSRLKFSLAIDPVRLRERFR